MVEKSLTDSELMLLGLVAEMPRHGYELEQVIEERGVREWAQIGFSSIYFVLGKLEKRALVAARKPAGPKAKKQFTITPDGQAVLAEQSLAALRDISQSQTALMMGMMHWPFLSKAEAIDALAARETALIERIEYLETERFRRQPLPDYVDRSFDLLQSRLRAELDWLVETKNYFEHRQELED